MPVDSNTLSDSVGRDRFRLKQGGVPVAWSEGPNALAEILHYARVYSQDGPVMIEHHRKGRWSKLPTPPALEERRG